MIASISRIRPVVVWLGYLGLVAALVLALAVGRTSGTWTAGFRQGLVLIAFWLLALPVVSVLFCSIWRGEAKGTRRQLTLRTLFVEVTLFGATAAYLASLCFSIPDDRLLEQEIGRIRGKGRLTIESDADSSPVRNPAVTIRALAHANLESLKIRDQPIDALLLKNIGRMRRLRTLEITDCNLSDEQLVHLAGLSNLKYLSYLSLANTNVSDDGVKHLANLKWLRYLDLSGTKVTGAGFPGLAQTIRALDLRNTPLTPAGLENIGLLKGVSTLCLENVRLDAIPKHPSYLRIRNCHLSPNAFKEIGELENLYGLWLAGTNLSDDELPMIASLSIDFLDLSETMITDAGFVGLEPMKNLNRVSLAKTRVGDEAAAFLSRCPKVYSVNLSNTATGDAGARSLIKLMNNLACEPTTGDGTPLPPEFSPVYVNLYKTKVSKETIEFLEKKIGEWDGHLEGVNTGPEMHGQY